MYMTPDSYCEECGTDCLKCTQSNVCSTCKSATMFSDKAGDCKNCGNDCLGCKKQELCDNCKLASMFSDPAGDCQACGLNCLRCQNLESCDACPTYRHFYDVKARACALCDANCLYCSGTSTNCISCQGDQFLDGNKCTKCADNCLRCQDLGECYQCAEDYNLKAGLCSKKAPVFLIVLIVLGVGLVIGGSLFYYLKYVKKPANVSGQSYASGNSYHNNLTID